MENWFLVDELFPWFLILFLLPLIQGRSKICGKIIENKEIIFCWEGGVIGEPRRRIFAFPLALGAANEILIRDGFSNDLEWFERAIKLLRVFSVLIDDADGLEELRSKREARWTEI